ncbi:acyltransferase family protein [Sphingomonas sp. Leaf339]|uniref:acyltransferase family protein n=1 Tax=Sphingomonas sp. Leaf339 TaxID=1736343 RepID=UPI0009EA7510|nr:acyltransferase [Sphingomonas sp. Leaf339]
MEHRRYLTLDAMRGVAAIAVFSMHAGPFLAPFIADDAFLAVDLFFLISGVIIDRVYGARIANGLTTIRFFINRFARFYPLYITGTAVGCFGAFISLALGQGTLDIKNYIVVLLTSIFMLPSPTESVDSFAFPFNYATWSLFFELVINIAFVAIYRWLNPRVLITIAFLSALIFSAAAISAGTVSVGAEWDHFWAGFPRVTFSFATGVIISRININLKIVTQWSYMLALLPVILFFTNDGIYFNLFKVIILFPGLVFIALIFEPASNTDKAKPAMLLGAISYPLYVIHVPIMQFVERACTLFGINRQDYAPIGGLALGVVICVISLFLFHVDEKIQFKLKKVINTV